MLKVHEVDGVAVEHPVLRAQILVLTIVVLVAFHDPYPGKACVVEGRVMATPAKAIQAINHARLQLGEELLRERGNAPGQLPGGAIHFAPIATIVPPFRAILGHGNRF